MADVAAQLSDLEWPVRTSRLLLRQAEVRDEDAIWSYRRDEETARWLSSWPVDRSAFHPSIEQPAEWAGMRETVYVGEPFTAPEWRSPWRAPP